MIQTHHHDIAGLGQGTPFIAGQVVARPSRVASAMNPDEDRTLLAVAQARCPYVEHQAALLVHRLSNKLVAKAVIRLTITVVPAKRLILRSLWSPYLALSDLSELVRGLRRHKPLSFGIAYTLEGENTAILIPLDGSIDRLHTRMTACRDGLGLHSDKRQ